MERLLVTIEGPTERRQVALPSDLPIAQVIPMIRDLLAPEAGATWQPDLDRLAVGLPGKGLLPKTSTLGECGVEEGATLYVCEVGSGAGGPEPGPPGGWTPPAVVAVAGGAAVSAAAATAPTPPPQSPPPEVGPSTGLPGELETPPAPAPEAVTFAAAPAPSPATGLPASFASASPVAPAVAVTARPGALPSPLPLSQRLRQVTAALLGSTGRAGGAGGGRSRSADPLTPRSLSRPQRVAALERALGAWEASDHRRRLDSLITAPRLARCLVVAVVSPKGGVGKTTISVLLGTLLSMLRNDRVVAVDASPDYGTLGRSLTPEHRICVDELLEVLDHPALTATLLDSSLGRGAHGLMVLPAPRNPERMSQLGSESYRRLVDKLRTMVGVVILDCGAGLHGPPTTAALAAADQLVLVGDSEALTGAVVAEAGYRLLEAGRPLFVVVNKAAGGPGELDLPEFSRHLTGARAIVRVPADRAAARALAMGEFSWLRAPRAWQVALRELAASMALDWSTLGLAA